MSYLANRKIKLGFSTCPNDTFIFDALVHKKIDVEGLDFEVEMADVEELNLLASHNKTDITKLSYHAYGNLSKKYKILDAGSAIGFGNGPLLVSRYKIYPDEISDIKIAIPGKNTTANLLLSLNCPTNNNRVEYLFSDIEDVVLTNEADAGLIIHESRFTYKEKGLKKIIDLGEFWEEKMQLPIPLGCIAAARYLPNDIALKFNRVLKRSIEYAYSKPESVFSFVRQYAQDMTLSVMQKHIDLYVNKFILSLGTEGRKAVLGLFQEANRLEQLPQIADDIFVINK